MRRLSNILITAGPTRERIDDIRFISNFSTGNMGYEIAKAALRRGYNVTLVSGPTALKPPGGARCILVEGAKEMERTVKQNFKWADCLFMASAVSDWRPKRAVQGKIKRGGKRRFLELVENPDILKEMGRMKKGQILAGFALEAGSLLKNAGEKLIGKNLDFIIANRVKRNATPFGAGRTDVIILDRYGGKEEIANATKKNVASRLLDRAEQLWESRGLPAVTRPGRPLSRSRR